MPRYIDANKLLTELGEEPMVWTDSEYEIQARIDHREFKSLIQDAPTADVVEVVRCDKCWYYIEGIMGHRCTNPNGLRAPNCDTYCPYGERKVK